MNKVKIVKRKDKKYHPPIEIGQLWHNSIGDGVFIVSETCVSDVVGTDLPYYDLIDLNDGVAYGPSEIDFSEIEEELRKDHWSRIETGKVKLTPQ